MKSVLCALLLIIATHCPVEAQQPLSKPLSKGEVLLLLHGGAADKRIAELVQQRGISFELTPAVRDELRKAGAKKALIDVLESELKPKSETRLGDQEILDSLSDHVPDQILIKAVQRSGINFVPTEDYLKGLRAKGATETLIETLRAASPDPVSEQWLLKSLAAGEDTGKVVEHIREHGINFQPSEEKLNSLRAAGATETILESVRTAKQFAVQSPGSFPPPCETTPKLPITIDVLGSRNAPDGVQVADPSATRLCTASGYINAPVLITRFEPSYTPEARRHQLEGTVELWIVVDEKGNVSDAQEDSKRLGDGLDEQALQTVKTWKFTPATLNSTPVAVRVKVVVDFKLVR